MTAPTLALALAVALGSGCGEPRRGGDAVAPAKAVAAFVEDVSFGAPPIPDDYKTEPLRRREAEHLLDRLVEIDGTISLTPEQALELNKIRRGLFAAPAKVHPGRDYAMSEVADLLKIPMSVFHWLGQWRGLLMWWSTSLEEALGPEAQRKAVDDFLRDELVAAPRLSELMTRIFLAAENGRLVLARGADCLEEGKGDIGYLRAGRNYEIRVDELQIQLVPTSAGPEAVAQSRDFVDLLRYACSQTLAVAFASAVKEIDAEQARVESYVRTWETVLAGWYADRVSVRVVLSNESNASMFVRRQVRVGIGAPGAPASVVVEASLDPRGAAGDGSAADAYLMLRRRTAPVVWIRFDLPEAAQALRDEGSSYLRVAFLVSAAEAQEVVLTPPAPFSREARERATRPLDALRIPIPAHPD